MLTTELPNTNCIKVVKCLFVTGHVKYHKLIFLALCCVYLHELDILFFFFFRGES